MQQTQEQVQPEVNPHVKNKVFTIGIIYNGFNADDIAFYKNDLIEAQKIYKEQLRFVVFGYAPEEDTTGMLDGLEFDYLPRVSSVHWPKTLEHSRIDMLFIPLIDDVFNDTTETDAKYLEAAILDIPVLAPNISTYQALITDWYNGFLYPPDNLKDFLQALLKSNITALKHCGRLAYERVRTNHTFTPQNLQAIEKSLKTVEEE